MVSYNEKYFEPLGFKSDNVSVFFFGINNADALLYILPTWGFEKQVVQARYTALGIRFLSYAYLNEDGVNKLLTDKTLLELSEFQSEYTDTNGIEMQKPLILNYWFLKWEMGRLNPVIVPDIWVPGFTFISSTRIPMARALPIAPAKTTKELVAHATKFPEATLIGREVFPEEKMIAPTVEKAPIESAPVKQDDTPMFESFDLGFDNKDAAMVVTGSETVELPVDNTPPPTVTSSETILFDLDDLSL